MTNVDYPYYFNPDLGEDINKKINLEIMKYAGMYVLKLIDLPPKEGGHIFEVPLALEDEHLEPVLDDLLFHGLIDIDTVRTCYVLTQDGRNYVDKLIGEVEAYIDKYQEFEPTTKVNLMRRDNINPLRARFLWGLYDGEFDDLNEWQDNWQINPAERVDDWRFVITRKEFYDMLFEHINNMEVLDDDALDEVLRQAQEDRRIEAPQIQITRVDNTPVNVNYPREEVVYETRYYHDPYYFNPVYDPLFWYIVF